MVPKILKGFLIFSGIVGTLWIFKEVQLVRMAGPLMLPILLVSYFAFALIFAKMRQLAASGFDLENFLKDIFENVERQRIKEAIDLCDKADNPTARILKAGIMKYDRPKDEIREAMQDSFLYELPVLEDNLAILATIVQIAPLLGFLGTLVGIINIFATIQAKAASFAPVSLLDLASGIWQALLCPAAGFLVAIPVLIAHNYLNSRIKAFVDESERAATELLEFLMQRRMSL